VIIDPRLVAAALPGYKLGDHLGTGGFGLVLAARHRKLRRDVAIKVIPAETALPGKEFATEAALLASLDHPHIVRVHDYLETRGLGLIVMELCAGGTLTERRASLSPPQKCAVGLAVAAGLSHAHSRGILHRDIKMGNVLFDADGRAKVGDFGIARMFTGSGVTGTASGAGTPMYMAPEQIIGGRLGPPTDIYALGVLLYFLFNGRPPFDPTLTAPQLWQAQLASPPRPMTDVPAPIADVILRALAKDPVHRPPDADTFAEELAAAADDVHGPAWLADTGVPLHLSTPVRQAAAPERPEPRPPPEPEAAGAKEGEADRPDRSDRQPLDAGTRMVRLAVVVTAFVLAAGFLAIVLLPGGSPAVTAADRQAWSRQLAAASAAAAVRNDTGLAKRLAVAAYRTAPTPQARVRAIASLAGTTQPRATLVGYGQQVAFSADGRYLATGGANATVRLWDTSTHGRGQPLASFTGSSANVNAIAFSPDSRLLATAGADGAIRLWDTSIRGISGTTQTLSGTAANVNAIAFSPNSRLLASVSDDGTAWLWDTSDINLFPNAPVARLVGHESIANAVTFSPDGLRLATGADDDTVRLWDAGARGTVRPLATYRSDPPGNPDYNYVYAVAFSPDGHLLATSTSINNFPYIGFAQLWNPTGPTGGRPLATLSGHTNFIVSLTFSPNGRLLATTSPDGTARLWSTTSRGASRPSATFTGTGTTMYTAVFAPDGAIVATPSTSGIVYLWDAGSRGSPRPLTSFTGGQGNVYGAAFAPDGRTLATISGDGVSRLWDTDPAALATQACLLTAGRLSEAEWRAVLPRTPYQPPCG